MINNRQNGRRRGRGGTQVRGPNNGPDRGNRIDNRARGNAAQLHEKYKNLARDAQTQGDRVMTEYYLQFADHYFRVLNESRARFEEQGQQQRRPRYEGEDFDDGGDEGEVADDGAEAEVAREPREPRREQRERRPMRAPRERAEPQGEPVVIAEAPPAPAAAEAQPAVVEATEEAPRPRRGRPPRRKPEDADAPQRIEVDRLPPAMALAPADDATEPAAEGEAAPRRRRTRRTATSEDVAA